MTVSVLVPSSLTRETEDKREATRKLGTVARAAAVFRVDRVIVYPDPKGDPALDPDAAPAAQASVDRVTDGFVRVVLAYAATPPHLRKEIWGRRDELEYVGVLPPLRLVSQTGSGDRPGSLRQGIVTEVGPDGRVRVTCGLQHPVSLPVPDDRDLAEGARVTLRISSRRPFRGRIVDESPPGFRVQAASLQHALAAADAGLRVAASEHGTALTRDRLATLPGREGSYTVAFGAPGRGLPEILGVDPETVGDDAGDDTDGHGDDHAAPETDTDTDDDDTDTTAGARAGTDDPSSGDGRTTQPSPDRFDLWLNTVPNQGSAIVRTEEALIATLAALNLE